MNESESPKIVGNFWSFVHRQLFSTFCIHAGSESVDQPIGYTGCPCITGKIDCDLCIGGMLNLSSLYVIDMMVLKRYFPKN